MSEKSPLLTILVILSLILGLGGMGLGYYNYQSTSQESNNTNITILNQSEPGMLFTDPVLTVIALTNLTIEFDLNSTSDIIANFHFSGYLWDDSGIHIYIWLDSVIPSSPFYRISANASSMNIEDSILKIFPNVTTGSHEINIGVVGYHPGNYIFDRNLDLIIISQD